jgi:hypothetical protein
MSAAVALALNFTRIGTLEPLEAAVVVTAGVVVAAAVEVAVVVTAGVVVEAAGLVPPTWEEPLPLVAPGVAVVGAAAMASIRANGAKRPSKRVKITSTLNFLKASDFDLYSIVLLLSD